VNWTFCQLLVYRRFMESEIKGQAIIEALWPIQAESAAGVYGRLARATAARLAGIGIQPGPFSHVGIAVQDVRKTAAMLALKNDPEWGTLKVEWGSAFGCHVVRRKVNGMEIEIIQPVSPSHLRSFLETAGEGVHHLSFEVGDIKQVLETLRRAGGEMAHPQIMSGLHGRIAFFSAPVICPVSLELCQPLKH
jgi:methylmalonyl-CoA/ethylmalonyl-CoA epimerase